MAEKRYTGYNSQGMMNLVNNIIKAREFNQKMGLQQDSLNLERGKALVDQQYKADTLEATKDWRTKQGKWRQEDKIRAEKIRTEDLNRDAQRYIAEQLRLTDAASDTATYRADTLAETIRRNKASEDQAGLTYKELVRQGKATDDFRESSLIEKSTARQDAKAFSEAQLAERIRSSKVGEAHQAKSLDITTKNQDRLYDLKVRESNLLDTYRNKVLDGTLSRDDANAQYNKEKLAIEQEKVKIQKLVAEKTVGKEELLNLQMKAGIETQKQQDFETTKDFPTKSASQFKESIYSGETGVFGRINIDPDQVLGAFLDQSTGGGKELNSLIKFATNPRNKTTTNRDKATAVLKDGLMTMLKDADFYNSAKKREKLDQAVGQIGTYIDQLKGAGANTDELTELLASVLEMKKSYPKPKVKSEYNPRQGFGRGTY